MDDVRIKDSSISRNIDLYLEELKREQAAREKWDAEHASSQNERTGNEAMSLDDREDAGGQDEKEDWEEEEYVMLDLDDVFHGAPVPSFSYTLSGLDTLNPILTLDNGLKLIGHYMETIGSVVVYSEKDSCHLQSAVENTEKKPRKRIRGVCKLERKLKFCAMAIDSAPAGTDMPVEDEFSLMKTIETHDASFRNATQTQDEAVRREGIASLDQAMPTEENASLDEARPMDENAPLEEARPTEENASLDKARPTEENASLDEARPTEENASLDKARPTEG